jgi:hypothetical protein
VSDPKSKTVNRIRHWLFKAKGKAILCSKSLVIVQGRLGIAMSIKYDDQALAAVDIETFRISNSPPDQMVTRSSTYGKIVLLESLVYLFPPCILIA